MKQVPWKVYALFLLMTEGVGFLSGWLTRDGAETYRQSMVQPSLSPPAMVFPIVWGILFALMAIAAARIWRSPPSELRTRGLVLYGIQLAFNFFWSILFFNLQAFGFALLWLAALWGLILWTLLTFRRVDPAAAWLLLPYLLWVSFAAWLNLGVWYLNR